MKAAFSKLPLALLFVAACAASTGAMAQDSKKVLATKLAQMQAKSDGATMANQLTAEAVQLPLSTWSQRLDESVPPARQKDVRDKLDVELKKFADNTHKAIDAQVSKAAESALVPLFMDKLSEDEMKTIIAYMESPAAVKFQSLSADAGKSCARYISCCAASSRPLATSLPQVLRCACGRPVEPEVNRIATTWSTGISGC